MGYVKGNLENRELILNAMVKMYPEMSKYKISQIISQIQGNVTPHGVYRYLTKMQMRASDLPTITNDHKRRVFTEIMPLAIKEMKGVLKDKDMSHKDKLPYVKQVIQLLAPEQDKTPMAPTINIKSLQSVINNNMGQGTQGQIKDV